MANIEWTHEAEQRLRAVHEYISADNPAAANRVVVQIYEKVQLLRQHPRLGQRYEPIANREVREILYGHYRKPFPDHFGRKDSNSGRFSCRDGPGLLHRMRQNKAIDTEPPTNRFEMDDRSAATA